MTDVVEVSHRIWGGQWTLVEDEDSFTVTLVFPPTDWGLMQSIGWSTPMSLPMDDRDYFIPWTLENFIKEPRKGWPFLS